MKTMNYLLVASMLALTACGGSSRPVYSGKQESTEGIPGFKNGKKQSPYVKLGQSYTVDGETHTPRYQPGYKEEGMASWYGPGFHGGKTANGEEFDKHAMTAAHRTLPLPSMVKVTLLATGKSAIVRVNDRGPFSKGRIIDLSYAAAKEIGMLGMGTGKVRVEYLDQETARFNTLLASGRHPNDIDVNSEVLGAGGTAFASNSYSPPQPVKSESWISRLNPISSAHAKEPTGAPLDNGTYDSADSMEVTSTDLAAPVAVKPVAAPAVQTSAIPNASDSPFSIMNEAGAEEVAVAEPLTAPAAEPVAAAPAPVSTTTPIAAIAGQYFQLGAFSSQLNAQNLASKVGSIGTAQVEPKSVAGNNLYVVRMGPYATVEESSRVLAQLNRIGINPQTITK